MTTPPQLDYEDHWLNNETTYAWTPSVRHRRRLVIKAVSQRGPGERDFIFDFGCGSGQTLEALRRKCGLRGDQLGGCDTSPAALKRAREKGDRFHLYAGSCPEIGRPCDIVICSEVLEHVEDDEAILVWTWQNLAPDGLFVLTVPGGECDPPDKYYGHLRHYQIDEVCERLKQIGFTIRDSFLWGFPFFLLQKYITKRHFQRVRTGYMGGPVTVKKRLVFGLAYYLYFLHDFVNAGPQIFIIATRCTS